jgi:hypothetical protein
MIRMWIGLTAVLLLAVHVSPAQTLDSLQAGTRIRLIGRTGGVIIGDFDTCSADVIKLYASGRERIVSIPWSVVSSVQMSTGSHTNAGMGASTGFLSGTLLAALLALTVDSGDMSGSGVFGFLELRLAIPGLLLGALIGSMVRTDVWIDVSDARTHRTGMNMRLNREIRIGFRF